MTGVSDETDAPRSSGLWLMTLRALQWLHDPGG
jgi:hypothetical protein